jgi:hypothetical protein
MMWFLGLPGRGGRMNHARPTTMPMMGELSIDIELKQEKCPFGRQKYLARREGERRKLSCN